MKFLTPLLAALTASLLLTSCGNKGGTPKSHAEVGQAIADLRISMEAELAKVGDVASAEAFAASTTNRVARMKELLKIAQELPAPTSKEKEEVNALIDAAEDKVGPTVMARLMSMSQNPTQKEIKLILDKSLGNEEMKHARKALEAVYRGEG